MHTIEANETRDMEVQINIKENILNQLKFVEASSQRKCHPQAMIHPHEKHHQV